MEYLEILDGIAKVVTDLNIPVASQVANVVDYIIDSDLDNKDFLKNMSEKNKKVLLLSLLEDNKLLEGLTRGDKVYIDKKVLLK